MLSRIPKGTSSVRSNIHNLRMLSNSSSRSTTKSTRMMGNNSNSSNNSTIRCLSTSRSSTQRSITQTTSQRSITTTNNKGQQTKYNPMSTSTRTSTSTSTSTNNSISPLLLCTNTTPSIPHVLTRSIINTAAALSTSSSTSRSQSELYSETLDTFSRRHIGPSESETMDMLATIGVKSVDECIDLAVPKSIRLDTPLSFGDPKTEHQFLKEFKTMAKMNQLKRNYIGQGYYGTIVPPVILRNVLENPGWYTAYTPYQAEIAQGRLESLLNFQTMCSDLTGMDIANASLLDEATAGAEAMAMCFNVNKKSKAPFFVANNVHEQTLEVIKTRANALGIEVIVDDPMTYDFGSNKVTGALLQYPATDGTLQDYRNVTEAIHDNGGLVACATDLLALTVLTPPGEWGADIAFGSAQRFGVPMGNGGPHAAFLTCRKKYQRSIPGRIIGVSVDSQGNPALRMALQTREQHIRREKATSNICTAQALLANIAAHYAVYHGPEGLKDIGQRVHNLTEILRQSLVQHEFDVQDGEVFDTLKINLGNSNEADAVMARATVLGMNFRRYSPESICVSLDETVELQDLLDIGHAFTGNNVFIDEADLASPAPLSETFARTSDFLTHDVFNKYHSETEMLRYLKYLEDKDVALNTSMIALGSCTMKLNATAEMIPVTWPEFGNVHPFQPAEQLSGYEAMYRELSAQLCDITGFAGMSLQPNSGAQGEFAGLMTIASYHKANGDDDRTICLIPTAAHGTNPASAQMAGMKTVIVKCDKDGNTDMDDLRAKCEKYSDKLAAFMITYPSTHGVFEEHIKDMIDLIHQHGGQVYMDGANMNAQCGITSPGAIGADVCHLNLHKTFCIPHGGGGPGMGPIGVAEHLIPYLPSHPLAGERGPSDVTGPVNATPYGSASILPISYVYISMMGAEGIKKASEMAIVNANYMRARLADHYPVLYLNDKGACAHEFILDMRPFDKVSGIAAEDVAKRLADYGFHAPTMSFPVANTLMIEPTESEPKDELDRFCDAMIQIRKEIEEIEDGLYPKDNNVLVNAPHTLTQLTNDEWDKPYSREKAGYPVDYLRIRPKKWPTVGRVDNVYGDRNLVVRRSNDDVTF